MWLHQIFQMAFTDIFFMSVACECLIYYKLFLLLFTEMNNSENPSCPGQRHLCGNNYTYSLTAGPLFPCLYG